MIIIRPNAAPAIVPAVPAVFVAVTIGVTVPSVLATYRVFPSGVLMIESDSPVAIGCPTIPVPTEIGVTPPPGAATHRTGGIDTADAGFGGDPVRIIHFCCPPHLAGPRLYQGLRQPAGEHLPAAPPPVAQ